jgi:histidine ammonia-lyase
MPAGPQQGSLRIEPGQLDAGAAARDPRRHGIDLDLADEARPGIRAGAALVQSVAGGSAPVYGVNTGFGKLADKRIDDSALEALQLNLDPFAQRWRGRAAVAGGRATHAGAQGGQPGARLLGRARGAHRSAAGRLQQGGRSPTCPAQGSVGASGDLAPLAHMTLALLGEGEFLVDGARVPAAVALARFGLAPLRCAPRKGWR